MTLPDFLVIGAMKSGTTTVYHDLLTQPGVFAPLDKEPETLCTDEVLTPTGLAAYEKLFKPSKPGDLCFEASTAYAKLPDFAGMAERAARLRDEHTKPTKAVYIVRDPIKRLISHHHHEYSERAMPADVNEAVESFPRLANYSKYAMQVEPWINALGRENVHIILFERYIADRAAGLAALCTFLGLTPDLSTLDTARASNTSEGKPVHNPFSRFVANNPLYRVLIRHKLPDSWRTGLRALISSTAPPRPPGPSPDTIARVRTEIEDDMRRFAEILDEPHPIWPAPHSPPGSGSTSST
ncbi:MAG: sulfotransferase domain-containing protein [Planctomycetota bacterium]